MSKGYRRYTEDELADWIPQLVHDRGNVRLFYLSKAWRHLREAVLKRDHYECQMCKAEGRFTPATCVHHIDYVRRNPRRALDPTNCVALCDECHYKIHHKDEEKVQKQRWDDEKW